MNHATAYANANIAIVKYWGKTASDFNIPVCSSLSMTLSGLGTTVSLDRNEQRLSHELVIDENNASVAATQRWNNYLEQVRTLFPYQGHIRACSSATVPYASGLASSASFFAAAATALNHVLNLQLDNKQLSRLARLGSGSAARSIFGGMVALHGGEHCDHEDAFAFTPVMHHSLDLHMVVAMVTTQEKAISSREAMLRCQKTSPFFDAFVTTHTKDFTQSLTALRNGYFAELGQIMEHSTLKMFGTMWSAQPAINYWQPQSLALLDIVYALRREYGPIAFFTMDAGPNVKVLCQGVDVPVVVKAFAMAQATSRIVVSGLGSGAQIINVDTP